MPSPLAPDRHFALVQALRGLAALWVVLFHLEKGQALSGMTAALPAWTVHAVFGYGSAGVAVFFVLSGFVIAHSLADRAVTGRELGRFALRRSVRLDPPYWASILLVVAVEALLALAHREPPQFPSTGQVAAHLVYLQVLLGVPEIQLVYWTLTYEVQFYLVFALALWLRRREPRWASGSAFAGLYALALVAALLGGDWAAKGLFVNLWHGFLLGVLAYRAGHRRETAWPLLVLVGATLIGATRAPGVFGVPCAATALLLFAMARGERLSTSLAGRGWQWLGAISYSLYLVHIPALTLLTGAWQRVAGRGALADTVALAILLAACLVAAQLFHWLVERPSHRLARGLFRDRPRAAARARALPPRAPAGEAAAG